MAGAETRVVGVKWSVQTESWQESGNLAVDLNTPGTLQINGVSPFKQLICYCTARVNDSERSETWIAAFCEREKQHTDVPFHAAHFPFPFSLPLYPMQDVYFVSYAVKREGCVSQAPFTLGPVHSASNDLVFLALTPAAWKVRREELSKDVPASKVYETLQLAFDFLLGEGPLDAPTDEFFADEEVETDLLLMKQPRGLAESATTASGSSGQPSSAASSVTGACGKSGSVTGPGTQLTTGQSRVVCTDDDWNEDELNGEAGADGIPQDRARGLSEDDDDIETGNSSDDEEAENDAENDDDEDDDEDEEEEEECDDGECDIFMQDGDDLIGPHRALI